MDNFLEFLYCSNTDNPREMRRDLEACGVDVSRAENEVARILNQSRRASDHSWLHRARQNQATFEAKAKQHAEDLAKRFKSSKEILDAMLLGGLGAGVQAQAAVFFRNKTGEEISEKDLRTFLEDCLLLEII